MHRGTARSARPALRAHLEEVSNRKPRASGVAVAVFCPHVRQACSRGSDDQDLCSFSNRRCRFAFLQFGSSEASEETSR